MPSLLQRHPLAVALAGVAILLLLVVGLETGFGTAIKAPVPVPPAKPGAPVDAKLLPPIVAAAPEQHYPESVDRPLFTPTRRPAPPAPSVAANMVKGQFTLHGVIVVGDQRVAMLKEKSNGKMHRVEAGKEINGAKVSQIERESVTLSLGDDREVIPLQVQKAAAAAAGAPAAATTAQAGPFGGSAAGAPAAGAAAAAAQPGTPGATPGGPATVPQRSSPATPGGAPATAAAPPASTNPTATPGQQLTPEELLARRRARRNQQNQ